MSPDDALRSRLTSLTRDLILIQSTECRPQERLRCFEFLHHHLDNIDGLQIDYFDRNNHRSMVVRPRDCDAPQILLCGHLDVIEHSVPDCYHSRIESGRIYGPGSGDMKGQLAILVELMRALHPKFPGISLGLAITSDEERGGEDGLHYLFHDLGLRCGIAIIPDGGSINDVTIEEKGVLHARLHQLGREAHGARPWLGVNALELLLEQLIKLRRHFAQYWPDAPISEQVNHWFPTCSVTMFETDNSSPNRIPCEATAVIDVRFPPPHSVANMTAEIERALGGSCRLEPIMTAEPTHLDPDPLFCEITAKLTQSEVRLVRASGGSDSRFVRAYGIPVNLSRPLVGNLHSVDEWIDIASMVTYYRICETYIRRKLTVGRRD